MEVLEWILRRYQGITNYYLPQSYLLRKLSLLLYSLILCNVVFPLLYVAETNMLDLNLDDKSDLLIMMTMLVTVRWKD